MVLCGVLVGLLGVFRGLWRMLLDELDLVGLLLCCLGVDINPVGGLWTGEWEGLLLELVADVVR